MESVRRFSSSLSRPWVQTLKLSKHLSALSSGSQAWILDPAGPHGWRQKDSEDGPPDVTTSPHFSPSFLLLSLRWCWVEQSEVNRRAIGKIKLNNQQLCKQLQKKLWALHFAHMTCFWKPWMLHQDALCAKRHVSDCAQFPARRPEYWSPVFSETGTRADGSALPFSLQLDALDMALTFLARWYPMVVYLAMSFCLTGVDHEVMG